MTKTAAERFREGLDIAKSAMAVARDLGLALVVLLLLVWPATVAGRLEEAGFTEISGIVKWKSRITDSSQALAQLKAENDKLKGQLATTGSKLKELAQQLGPGAVAKIEPLRQANAAIQADANRAAATAVAALADNQELLAQSRGATPARWAVVLGGDATLAAALDEVKRAERAGLPAPRIYFRQKSYRTVSIVPEGTETGEVLDVARSRIRPDSYPVKLDTWCPNPIDRTDHLVCA